MRTYNFSNQYYVYDIESTKYEKGDDCPPLAYSYLHGIKQYTFTTEMTKDNIAEFSKNYISIRTNEDMEKVFTHINEQAEINNEQIVIFVHNLTYEFYNGIFNMPILHQALTDNPKNVFAISSTKIIKIAIGNLVFMDSLILFGKALALCASEVGMKKNEEHKTYNEIWTPESDLPQWEYDYNEHDLDIVAVYFSKFISLLHLKNCSMNGFIKSKILTQTGMVKYVCREINTPQALNIQRRIVKDTQKSITPDVQKWIENEVFRGGLCISIPCNTFNINANVHSIDFASSYPAVMCTACYPKGELLKTDGKRIKELDKLLTDKTFNYKRFLNPMYIYQPFKHFLFKVRLTNVKIKTFPNDNEFMYISKAKCSEVSTNSLIVNGRIIHADEIITSGIELDYILMRLFYDFDLAEIIQEYTPTMCGRLSEYKILSISKFAIEKEGFKKLENACGSYESFIAKSNETLLNDLTYGDVFKSTNAVASQNNMEHIKSICHTYLMQAKGKLNGQYGIGVQHQFQQDIIYNDYQFNIGTDERLNWSKNENYLQGIYIAGHARYRLGLMAYHLVNKGFNIIYFDTDSIKLMGDKDKLLQEVENWNDKIKLLRNRLINKYKDKNLFLANFGNFDYEGTYDYFITHGSKRYVTITDNKVSCTISGVNKKANSGGATLFYKKYGLDELHKKWCGLNTLFDYPLSKRSINFIPKEPMLIDDIIIDSNNKPCKVYQYSCEGISEKDCGYLLSSYSKPLDPIVKWYFYCKLFNNGDTDIELKPHSIIVTNPVYNEDGRLINGNVECVKGYVVEKYAEKLFNKWEKYFSKNKFLDYADTIYKIEHNYKNGVLIKNDIT